ncbi:MAG TPA: hypothetical protein VJB69_01760 [Candidatus Paceibacterota bacterium]
MEKDIQSSFIPKQTLSVGPRAVRQPMGLFLLLSLIVLIIALLFLGGAYAYRFFLTDEIERPCPSESGEALQGCGLLASLARRRETLNPDSIIRFETLDRQLRRATEIVDQHKTLLPVLRFIEEQTLQSIKYTSFNQMGNTLDLRGVAKSYEGVALQSIEFANNQALGLIETFVFSDVNADQAGNVGFTLKLTLAPSLFSYLKNLVL